MSKNPLSFERDIRPLFRTIDINHMFPFGVFLVDYAYMGDPSDDYRNARRVFERLTGTVTPRMPPGGPVWTADMLLSYEQWMADGFLP
jgi:hypothetical protein